MDEFDRLWSIIRNAPAALALAFVSAGVFAALATMFAPIAPWAALPLLAWLHGMFIVALVWKHIHPGLSLAQCVASPGLAAGAILGAAILVFALLDLLSGIYACPAQAIANRPSIPNLPWLWIGWLALTIGAAPIRAIGLVIGEQPPVIPIYRRAALCVPLVPVLVLVGLPFEWRAVDCTQPIEGFGLFEGGLFLILFVMPWLGLFWFVSSLSMAAAAGAAVDQTKLTKV